MEKPHFQISSLVSIAIIGIVRNSIPKSKLGKRNKFPDKKKIKMKTPGRT